MFSKVVCYIHVQIKNYGGQQQAPTTMFFFLHNFPLYARRVKSKCHYC